VHTGAGETATRPCAQAGGGRGGSSGWPCRRGEDHHGGVSDISAGRRPSKAARRRASGGGWADLPGGKVPGRRPGRGTAGSWRSRPAAGRVNRQVHPSRRGGGYPERAFWVRAGGRQEAPGACTRAEPAGFTSNRLLGRGRGPPIVSGRKVYPGGRASEGGMRPVRYAGETLPRPTLYNQPPLWAGGPADDAVRNGRSDIGFLTEGPVRRTVAQLTAPDGRAPQSEVFVRHEGTEGRGAGQRGRPTAGSAPGVSTLVRKRRAVALKIARRVYRRPRQGAREQRALFLPRTRR